MKFETTSLPGVRLIHLQPREDQRGYLARTFCERVFTEHDLNTHWPQCNHTLTRRRGTIRGFHWQVEPKSEIKLIRCVSGAIWDVLVDVRSDTPTFGKWEAFELTPANQRQLYVPKGVAHGFQSLADESQVFYQMSEFFDAELARGVVWDDPDLRVTWPVPEPLVSDRDRSFPRLHDLA